MRDFDLKKVFKLSMFSSKALKCYNNTFDKVEFNMVTVHKDTDLGKECILLGAILGENVIIHNDLDFICDRSQ
jgi:hypothetical protein